MALLQTSFGPIAYDELGSGPMLVMLPSGAHERRDYDELRAALGPGIRTVAIDWPAHGESPAGDGDGSAMRMADVAEQVVERLVPGGAVVLGNSVGGFAAARMAIRRPELVAGLVVIDGGGFTGSPVQARLFCSLMSRPRFLRAVYPAFSAMYMRSRTDADRRARERAIATTRTPGGTEAVAALWRSFTSPEHDLRAQAGAISAPTLFIWGRRDPVIPVRGGRRAAALVPGSTLRVLDTGHLPYTTEPGLVADEVRELVREVQAGRMPAGAPLS